MLVGFCCRVLFENHFAGYGRFCRLDLRCLAQRRLPQVQQRLPSVGGIWREFPNVWYVDDCDDEPSRFHLLRTRIFARSSHLCRYCAKPRICSRTSPISCQYRFPQKSTGQNFLVKRRFWGDEIWHGSLYGGFLGCGRFRWHDKFPLRDPLLPTYASSLHHECRLLAGLYAFWPTSELLCARVSLLPQLGFQRLLNGERVHVVEYCLCVSTINWLAISFDWRRHYGKHSKQMQHFLTK